MCFNFFNTPQEQLKNETEPYCSLFSCLNKNLACKTDEVEQFNDEYNVSDFYNQFFWEGMPLYLGKLSRDAKKKNNIITPQNYFDFEGKKSKSSDNIHNTLTTVLQTNCPYNNESIKKSSKNISQEQFNSQIYYINDLFEDIKQIYGKNNYDSLDGKLKTIPENEPLHYFRTGFYKENFHI
ncbi:hypothetical protein PCANB_003096 [Pneumocystis canis]|nr:hypothetical protein PCK1_003032 [Pneumocystis canis]KAG5438245.1 hypothetical protein PCANB_003096 [Pneumocystis canis]